MKKTYTWILILVLLGFVLSGIFISIAPDQIPAHYSAIFKICVGFLESVRIDK